MAHQYRGYGRNISVAQHINQLAAGGSS